MLKKILLTLITLSLFFTLTVPARAQTDTKDILRDFCDSRQDNNVINLETWYAGRCDPESETSTFMGQNRGFGDIVILHLYELINGEQNKADEDMIKDFFESLVDIISQNNGFNYLAYIKSSKAAHQSVSSNSGMISQISGGISYLISTPPASTRQYIAYINNNLQRHSLTQPAYAENATGEGGGYGFTRLEGFLPLWKAFRNIAYFFFILAFVIYGFMIMFRVKINPQTAANIQLALPKLIVTLILITFSYAIVGLLIDFMWVGYYLILNTLDSFGVFGKSWDGLGFINDIFRGLASGGGGLIITSIFQAVLATYAGVPGTLGALTGISGNIFTVLMLTRQFRGVSILLLIIMLIAVIIALIKLFVKLVTAYVTIFINLVLSPLILLGSIFPGKSDAFSSWITNLVANIVVFPVSSILLLFSGYFMTQPVASLVQDILNGLANIIPGIDGNVSLSLIDNTQRIPNVPLLSPQAEWLSNFPVIGSAIAAQTSEWYALIGLALLLMSPKFVDMVRDAFKVKPFPYGPELGIIGAPMAGIKKGFETSITQTTQPIADVYIGRAMDAAKRVASIGRRRSGGGTGGGTGTPPPPPGP
jgi:hypothetical protein